LLSENRVKKSRTAQATRFFLTVCSVDVFLRKKTHII
jgi:hypothetical protein